MKKVQDRSAKIKDLRLFCVEHSYVVSMSKQRVTWIRQERILKEGGTVSLDDDTSNQNSKTCMKESIAKKCQIRKRVMLQRRQNLQVHA